MSVLLRIQGDQAITPIPIELLETSSPQVIDFRAVGAHFVTIEVLSTYPSQLTSGNIFRELAIDKIATGGPGCAARLLPRPLNP